MGCPDRGAGYSRECTRYPTTGGSHRWGGACGGAKHADDPERRLQTRGSTRVLAAATASRRSASRPRRRPPRSLHRPPRFRFPPRFRRPPRLRRPSAAWRLAALGHTALGNGTCAVYKCHHILIIASTLLSYPMAIYGNGKSRACACAPHLAPKPISSMLRALRWGEAIRYLLCRMVRVG